MLYSFVLFLVLEFLISFHFCFLSDGYRISKYNKRMTQRTTKTKIIAFVLWFKLKRYLHLHITCSINSFHFYSQFHTHTHTYTLDGVSVWMKCCGLKQNERAIFVPFYAKHSWLRLHTGYTGVRICEIVGTISWMVVLLMVGLTDMAELVGFCWNTQMNLIFEPFFFLNKKTGD